MSGRTAAPLLFSLPPRHASLTGSFSLKRLLAERLFRRRCEEILDMRRLSSLLRAAPSRIGRRLALIVAIAAASLPAAGA
jgi:hypothetical protein